jgi:hypothetical protein
MEDADYVVEARAGSSGTDNHSLLIGVPQTNLSAGALFPGGAAAPTTIPEIPFAKRMEQRAIVKVALFAYNRNTGRPVWQSGLVRTESKAKHLWLFGTGPFERGSIYEGTKFAGDHVKIPKIPLIDPDNHEEETTNLSVADEAYFVEPQEELAQMPRREADQKSPKPSKPDMPPNSEAGPSSPGGNLESGGASRGQPQTFDGPPPRTVPPSSSPTPIGGPTQTFPDSPWGQSGLYPATR